jgi:predicted nuclease of predicted toxin-antitoxin system
MLLLADENIASTTIEELRLLGHDVLSAKESMRSEPDIAILARAQSENRTVLTLDKDFGELAFRSKLPGVMRNCAVSTCWL